MIKIKNIGVHNVENAIRGIRNSFASWDKADSFSDEFHTFEWTSDGLVFEPSTNKVGPKDLALVRKLVKAGHPHDKFMRQIFVSMDITAPFYWWKQMDQYKVGTTTNSESTMHNIMDRPLTREDFSFDDYENAYMDPRDNKYFIPHEVLDDLIEACNAVRRVYINGGKDKRAWRTLIQLLPSGYNQMRTWTGSFANLQDIVNQRAGHRLSEWDDFIDIVTNEVEYFDKLNGATNV